MDDIQDELQDSYTPDADTIQDTEIVPDVDVAALQEQNRQLYERAKKAEAKAKQYETPQETQSTNTILPGGDDERFERLELRTEGYNSDEVDFLMQNGGRAALNNKIAMAGIEAQRAKTKSLNATPSGTGKSPVYQKFTERDLKNMPLDELSKLIPQD